MSTLYRVPLRKIYFFFPHARKVCDGKLYITIIKAVLNSLDYYLLKSQVSETMRVKVGFKSCTQNMLLHTMFVWPCIPNTIA